MTTRDPSLQVVKQEDHDETIFDGTCRSHADLLLSYRPGFSGAKSLKLNDRIDDEQAVPVYSWMSPEIFRVRILQLFY